mgnify:CR=1 FL=1
MSKRYNYWLLALAGILVSRFIGMAAFPFVDTTEPRYAEIARLMAQTGDWITPWFEPGVPFWGKPPLSFWAQAAAARLLGPSEFALRLPSWLAAAAMIFLTWRFALQYCGDRVARWSALVLSTMALSYIAAGAVMTDAFLALGTTLSLASFFLAAQGGGAVWRWLFFLGLVIGLLAKGPLAVTLVGIPILLWIILQRRGLGDFKILLWPPGIAATTTLVLPWYILAELKTPGFLDYFLIGEHLRRFVDAGWTGDLYGNAHIRSLGMIWIFWLWASFPWGPVALGALVVSTLRGARFPGTRLLSDAPLLYVLLCATGPLLFFTLAKNTLWTYVLPSLPFSAIMIARWISGRPQEKWQSYLRAFTAILVPLGLSVFTLSCSWGLYPLKTEKSLINHYVHRREPGDSPLMYLGELPFSARFYSREAARAISPEALSDIVEKDRYRRYFVAFPSQWPRDRIPSILKKYNIEMKNQRYYLLSFERPAPDREQPANAS